MIEGKTKVWITYSNITPERIQEIGDNKDKGGGDCAVNLLSYSSQDMSHCDGWTEVGTAEIKVTFLSREIVLEKMAEGLRKEIQEVKAKAHVKVSQLEDKLNQLLALPNPDQS